MSNFALGVSFALQSVALVAFLIGYALYVANLWSMSK